jgi:hypothetical protein
MTNITAERLREALHYEPATGVFTRSIRTANCVKVGDVTGCLGARGYLDIRIDGRLYRAHRLAWLYMTGEWPKSEIDHINGIPADNRFCNLREATRSQNIANERKHVDNTSGFKGVSLKTFKSGNCRWQARIINRKDMHLGYYNTQERAFIAYIFAAWDHFGDYANIDADYIRAAKKRRMLDKKHRMLESVVL